MNNSSEVVKWTEEYMALVNADFSRLLPVQRRILEKSRELIMNNAAGHLVGIAPMDFLTTLPMSRRFFCSSSEPWFPPDFLED